MELNQVIGKIGQKHQFLGEISQESLECYNNEYFYSALFDLFIVAEHFCKDANDTTQGKFYQTINNLYENDKITFDEKNILNELKEVRNKMFHESLGMWFLEIDGKACPFNELDTIKTLYEMYAKKIFEIILKLLEQNEI